MNSKILVLSVLVAVVVGALSLYLIFNETPAAVQTSSETIATSSQETTAVAQLTGKDSLSNLMGRGENLECTVSYLAASSSVATEGTYFTSRGRMRGDFVVDASGNEMVSSMIMAEDTMYSWTEIEGKKYGMKISLSELAATKASDTTPEAQEAVPLDAEVKYACTPWKEIDGSIFEPPTDIVFTEFSNVMNTGMDFGTSYEGAPQLKNQCAACDELTGAARNSCRVSLSCE